MIELEDFLWGIFFFRNVYCNGEGPGLFNSDKRSKVEIDEVVKNMRDYPDKLTPSDVEVLIDGFLNFWGCRLHKSEELARSIIEVRKNIDPNVQKLSNDSLIGIDLDKKGDLIEDVYEKIAEIQYPIEGGKERHLGHTATSKLLFLLNPKLFVMWDNQIIGGYEKEEPRITASAEGYLVFLGKMQECANELAKELGREDPKELASYLRGQLEYREGDWWTRLISELNTALV